MNGTIKTRWLAALRSGEYIQGGGALHKDGAFCCLGVLCDLHAIETDTPWSPYSENGASAYLRREDLLPQAVEEWAGLYDDAGGAVDVPADKLPVCTMPDGAFARYPLPELNDMGVSFATLADLIEEQL